MEGKLTGEFIKLFRVDCGFTQRELADELDVTTTTISRWENKNIKPLKVYRKALRKVFGHYMDVDKMISEILEERARNKAAKESKITA